MRILPLLLGAASLLRADALADFKGRLQKVPRAEGLRAAVEVETWSRQGDDKAPRITQGRAQAWVESGAQGLRVAWAPDLVQKALQEARAQKADPEAPAPTRAGMAALTVAEIMDGLHPAERILQDLEGAKLLEARPDTLDGRPAQLLVVKLEPAMNGRDRKYVKAFEGTARYWLGPDGLPLAEERQFRLKGKALLVISFSVEDKRSWRFRSVNGSLVAVRHTRENTSSGGGENGQTKASITVTPG
ncbi:MAG TPA: hypothetical protein VK188_17075 [Holophaga sp.]|nr:hypothetical protein [Holophaga sp.]